MRFSTLLLLVFLILFSSCKKDEDKSKRYEVSKLLDDGEFQQALNELGNCDDGAFTKEECHLNRGMAYYGLAGYDLTIIGEDLYRIYIDKQLNEIEKNIKITSMIVSKFRGNYMSLGVIEYKKVLALQGKFESDCYSQLFKNLDSYSQQACISLNPVLLLEVIDNKGLNKFSVDLEDLIDFQNTVRGIVPGISSDEVAKILNGQTSDKANNELDATQCILNQKECFQLGMKKPELFGKYENLDIYKVAKQDNSFATLKILNENGSLVLTKENSFIYDDNSSCSKKEYLEFNKSHLCFPEPTHETLLSKGVEKLNNDKEFRESIGTVLNIGDETKTSEEKVDDLMTNICGYPNCTASQEDLIQYFQGQSR